ncbi:MAG: leucine-rich repeat domain-containing protein, partial [Candidatus Methanoplasma sp.]|nr:leucine-rich repeat domain-containing protein [Candidatus Methanoplasma sp.]
MNRKLMILAAVVASLAMISIPLVETAFGGEGSSGESTEPLKITQQPITDDNGYAFDLYSDMTAVIIASPENMSGSITIPGSVSYATDGESEKEYTVTKLGNSSFSSQKSITEVTIPKTVEEILGIGLYEYYSGDVEDGAFNKCTELRTVELEEGSVLETIGACAFYGNESLSSIDLSGVSVIGDFAFYGCTSLGEVVFADYVEIGSMDAGFSFANTGVWNVHIKGGIIS